MKQVAAIQMASGPNVQANLLEAQRWILQAVEQGAGLVVLPENFAHMGAQEQDKLDIRETEGQGPIQAFLAEQARKHGIWLVGGTIPLVGENPDKVRSSCLLYDASGEQAARYDKIHLFDVRLQENSEQYDESRYIEPGERAVVVDTPFGKLGLAICYDLRFPELFRQMVEQGAQLIALPSAFTATTGKAHWEPLVRARAIENLCYLIASDQGGYHVNGRETHGDSLIVNPWGSVLERLPRGTGVVVSEIDLEQQGELRRSFPVLQHRRL